MAIDEGDAMGRTEDKTSHAVDIVGISKSFGPVTAIDNISLSVRKGDLITLLGPSGCGKTTLLNLVAGFETPSGGTIEIDGRNVTGVPAYQRDTGMVFQSYALFPHMNVFDNVAFGLRMRRVPVAKIAADVGQMLDMVKLKGLETRRVRQLSGGQQQRVALARALVIRPKVLLLDEPFSALDRNLRASMQVEIKEIQHQLGVTTIFVTHDQSEALSLSDRIAVMAQGRIRQVGTPDEIYHRPRDRFVASFVGDANIVRARLLQIDGAAGVVGLGATRITVPAQPLAQGAAGAMVDLFLRPEQLRVAGEGDPIAAEGIIATQIYQGGHVDFYLDAVEACAGRLLMRLPGRDAITRWPVGFRVAVTVLGNEAVAFFPDP
jgi:putative spermidine/putrescine transport system ATP-binding protein